MSRTSRARSFIWCPMKQWPDRSGARAARCAMAICSRKRPTRKSSSTTSIRRSCLSAIAELQKRVCRLLRELDKGMSIVSLSSAGNGKQESTDPLLRHLMLPDIFEEFCASQLLDTMNVKKVERIRSLFAEAKKIHILLQHDPDPDAIGSALALRELLGRNRATTPIVTFGEITRPENLMMIRLLDIQIERISQQELHKDGARLALVDVQPPYFDQPLRPGRSRRRSSSQARGIQSQVCRPTHRLRRDLDDLYRISARCRHGAVPAAGDGAAFTASRPTRCFSSAAAIWPT